MIGLFFLTFFGCAHHVISGSVVDRNGDSIARANVRLAPGNVDTVTDDSGAFSVDYLRDDEGNRTKLAKRTHYEVSVFRVGYHEQVIGFDFKRGALELETITLLTDTIKVSNSGDDIDTAKNPDRAQSGGGSYEGE